MNYLEIYFVVVSISTIIVAVLLVVVLIYILAILYDIKKLSKIAKKESEIIAKGFEVGANILGSQFSNEAAGFVKTVFALLLSHFVTKKVETKVKKEEIEND